MTLTLQFMVRELEGSLGSRYQVGQPLVLRHIDMAQKMAFNHDCRAFMRTAELGMDGVFPEDAREIISVSRRSVIDSLNRMVICDSDYPPQVRYYIRPPTLTGTEDSQGCMVFTAEDEAKVIVPEEWRQQVLMQPAIALMDGGLYGDRNAQSMLEGYYREWWQAMDARPPDRKPPGSLGAW